MNELEGSADVPTMLALIVVVGLWGFFASAATVYLAALGY
jgi:hypothetical protein